MYHQQQNEWYRMIIKKCLLAHFEDTFDFSRREYTAHDNLWL